MPEERRRQTGQATRAFLAQRGVVVCIACAAPVMAATRRWEAKAPVRAAATRERDEAERHATTAQRATQPHKPRQPSKSAAGTDAARYANVSPSGGRKWTSLTPPRSRPPSPAPRHSVGQPFRPKIAKRVQTGQNSKSVSQKQPCVSPESRSRRYYFHIGAPRRLRRVAPVCASADTN